MEIRRNWLIVALVTLPFVAYYGYQAFSRPITYTARLTFMLNEDRGGNGLASMLGQFGGLLGGTEDYQMEKILELARSRRIISGALFKRYNLNGQEDFYANHVIRVQRLHDKWKNDSTLNGFLFTRENPADFNRIENKALLALHGEIIGSGEGVEGPMFGTGLNNDTGIMTLSMYSRDEMLAIDLLNTLYQKISTFYVDKSVERERETLKILAQKRDSIGRVLNRNDVASASFEDRNNALLMEINKVPGKRYQRNNQLLSLVYGEAIKNAELAEFAMKSSTPFLSVIDVPIPPIKPDARGRAVSVLIGLALGLLISTIFIVGRKIFRDTMAKN